MKKLILILLGIFLLTAVVFGIFLATFDINRFKTMVEEKLVLALGNPVRVGRLALGWDGGLSVGFRDLEVFEKGSSLEDAALRVGSTRAVLELGSLLKKQIQFASIVIKTPSVHVIKNEDGSFKIRGLNLDKKEKSPESPNGNSSRSASAAFLIGEVRIQDGTMRITDRTFNPPVDIFLRKVDLTVKNVSLDRPMTLALQAGLFAKEQNAKIRGKIRLVQGTNPGILSDFSLDLDLARLDDDELRRQIPPLKDLKLKEDLEGKLHISVSKMELGSPGKPDIEAQLVLSDGKIFLADLPSAFAPIQLEAKIHTERFVLNRFDSEFAGGRIRAQGQSEFNKINAPMSFAFNASDLQMSKLVPGKGPGKPSLKGRLWLDFQGRGLGSDWASISRTLQGQGKVTLKEGVLVNVNVLRDVLKKMSAVPGLAEGLDRHLTPAYRERLNEPNTLLSPTEIPVVVRDGILYLNNFALATNDVRIHGNGRASLTGALEASAILNIHPDLSQALMRSVNSLQYIMNQQGELEIPVTIRGTLSDPKIAPDMNYIFNRVVSTKGQELIMDLLAKKRGDPAGGAQSSSGDQVQDLLKGFLGS